MKRRSRSWSAVIAGAIGVLGLICGLAIAGSVGYQYDELGRLIESTDSAGNVVRYQYDASGNILSTTRRTSSTLSVTDFSPNAAAIGATVVIQGSGFSTTASANAVKFNGVAAVVSSAKSSQLTVTVPSGATTGLISVTVAGATASSPFAFTVGALNPPPSIASFSPLSGTVGSTVVTITGSNFSTLAGNNKITFGGTGAVPTSATASQLVVTVPSGAGSGKIGLTTPGGSTSSASDFIALPAATPSGCSALGPLGPTGRVVQDAAASSYNFATAGQTGAVLFQGTQGQYLTLNLSGMSMSSANVTVLGPQSALVTCASVSNTPGGLQLPKLQDTGTYTVYVTPNATGTLKLAVQSPITGQLTAGGTALPLNFVSPARRALLTFSGNAGQSLTLTASGVTLGAGSKVSILNPSGTALLSAPLSTTTTTTLSPQLPMTGTYSVLIEPATVAAGSATLRLSTNAAATVATNGTTTTALAGNGNTTSMSFDALQNQRYTLVVAPAAWSSPFTATVNVVSPDGTTVATGTVASTACNGCSSYTATPLTLNTGALSIAGRYAIQMTPSTAYTGNVALTLSTPIQGGTLSHSNSPLNIASKLSGQGEQFTVSALAQEQLSVSITHTDTTAAPYSATAMLLSPTGELVTSAALNGNTTVSLTAKTAVSGAYTVLLQQNGYSASGSESFSLNGVTDGSTMAINSQVVINPSALGTATRIYFDGTAGQRVTFAVGRTTSTAVSSHSFKVMAPSGAEIVRGVSVPGISTCVGGQILQCPVKQLGRLTETGRYAVVFEQSLPNTSNGLYIALSTPKDLGDLQFKDHPGSITRTATGYETEYSVHFSDRTLPGQSWQFNIDATSGQFAAFTVTYADMSPRLISGTDISAFANDIRMPVQVSNSTNGQSVVNIGPAPVAAKYTVIVDHSNSSHYDNEPSGPVYTTVSPSAALYAGNLIVDGSLSYNQTMVDGQVIYYTFNGIAGQQIKLIGNQTMPDPLGAYWMLYPPSGKNPITDGGWNLGGVPSGCSTNCTSWKMSTQSPSVFTLPETGVYRYVFFRSMLSQVFPPLAQIEAGVQNAFVSSTVSLQATPSPVATGQAVNFTVVVKGNIPSGSVDIFDGSTLISQVGVTNGIANYSTNFSNIGSHSLTARYNGDSKNAASTSAPVALQVMTPAAYSAYISAITSIITNYLLGDN